MYITATILPSADTRNLKNITFLTALQWTHGTIVSQRPCLIFCILGTLTHAIFWVQVFVIPSYRQRNMQWIFVYLITDQLLILRFFISYIIHTSFYHTASNTIWTLIVCFKDATLDNYLNVLAIYVLLMINLCRYFQIVHNRNVYQTNIYLLVFSHFIIYSVPIMILAAQLAKGWAELVMFPGNSCDINYVTTAIQIINVVHGYALPIFLNVLVIILSVYHVHMKTYRRRAQVRISARDKYHRSLVTQFLLFYAVWLAFWSPDVVIYQFTSGDSMWAEIASLLNYAGIALDPIVIAALDVRIRKGWILTWHFIRKKFRDAPIRVAPTITGIRERTRF